MAVLSAMRRCWRGLLLAAAFGAVAGCFNPQQPACAFSCAGNGLCPSGYTCAADQLCHRTDGQGGVCLEPDAATDGARDGLLSTRIDAATGQ